MYFKTLWLSLGIAYIVFILAVSLLRVPEVQLSLDQSDKIIHFLLYFILVGWFVQLYKRMSKRLIILAGAITLGMFIETLQGMTGYRSFDLLDQVANSIGAICAFLLAATRFDTLLANIDLWLYQSRR